LRRLDGGRFQLIRQERSQSDYINFFLAVTREHSPYIRNFKLKAYEDLLGIDIPGLARPAQRVQPTQPTQEDHENPPLHLVCTDGKHDKCCAKYGLRAYRYLKERFGESVWESSHVGGDRFAANMVCFPHGVYFGRVSEAEAERVVSGYCSGQIYLDKYRGRSCYSHNAQVGEHFVRSQSGNVRLDGLRLLDEEPLGEDRWQVRFSSVEDGTIHTVRFRRELSSCEIPSSCHSEERRRVAQYELLEYSSFECSALLPLDQPGAERSLPNRNIP
jgi:hypothetical protein